MIYIFDMSIPCMLWYEYMLWYDIAIECNVLFNMIFVNDIYTWACCDDGIYVMIWYDML